MASNYFTLRRLTLFVCLWRFDFIDLSFSPSISMLYLILLFLPSFHENKSSGASTFLFLLAQLEKSIGIVDLYVGRPAPEPGDFDLSISPYVFLKVKR